MGEPSPEANTPHYLGVSAVLQLVARLWDDNQEWLKERLGQAGEAPFPARWVYMPEIPSPRFNHVSAITLPRGEVRDATAAAKDWFRAKGLPFACIMVSPATVPSDLGATLRTMGWTVQTSPVMMRRRQVSIPVNSRLTIRPVSGAEESLFFEVMLRVFLDGAGPAQLRLGRRNATVLVELGGRNYVAFDRGSVAGVGSLLSRSGMGGIYNMATLPQYRGMGIARSVLARAIRDAADDGSRLVCLTPTPMGRSLYEAAGFDEIFQEQYYTWWF